MSGGRRHPLRRDWPALDALPEASRRDVLRSMAASFALAAAGCDGPPPPEAVPYVRQPEELVPGRPLTYATAVSLSGWARPVLAEVHMGRPTRLDGNPRHPAGSGAADPFMQAEVLTLYDPDRSRTAVIDGRPAGEEEADRALAGLADTLRRTGGDGARLLTGRITSPTLSRQIAALTARLPGLRRHVWEATGSPAADAAMRMAFGRPLRLRPRLDRAAALVCLGADPLGPGPEQLDHAALWAERRKAVREGRLPPGPLLVAEATPSLTGMQADGRLPVAEARLPLLLTALAQALGESGAEPPDLTPAEHAFVARAAAALAEHAGRALLLTGGHLPPAAQALGHRLALRLAPRLAPRLDAAGTLLEATEPVADPLDDPDTGLAALAQDMADGRVSALLMIGSNPVQDAPAGLHIAELLARVPLTLHAGLYRDETGMAAAWHLPLAHELESWGDLRAPDGTATIVQPTVRPLAGRPAAGLLSRLLGEPASALDCVQATWREAWGDAAFAARWQEALRLGFVRGSAAPPVPLRGTTAAPPAAQESQAGTGPEGDGLEIVFRPDPTVWDGRYANNAWLQELPKPLTTLGWTNAVGVSPALARALVLTDGDLVEVAAGGRAVRGPALVLPGQAEGTLTLWLGYGRTAAGRNGTGLGYNAATVRGWASFWRRSGAALRPLGGQAPLPLAQREGRMHGGELARSVPLADPTVPVPAAAPPPPSLHPDWPMPGQRWAMAVDLDACIGCMACVVACQAENNIPSVGPAEMARGRAMHWLRVERYWTGAEEREGARFLPVLCMHCEKAPCEVGCPVNATVHGPDGLNQMVYNRCIGTRTCEAYCPYEVRRFNYLDHAAADIAAAVPQRNPDVTVRARGVIEKCTYCVQRIRTAENDAAAAGRPLATDAVTTACAAACPTGALVFGDLDDPASRVAALHAQGRAYVLLRELGTRPRTFYLARVDAGGGGAA
ncbi:4Fe-4S dicluster domain-containing protein [Rhodocista pekingensis]|uniref:4Fe-4S dicluster domain-containing protein n=1 Tax=Rhodocista pekingensis TaxID=201185 RepID=A0ABW2KR98_9PROT